MAIKVKRSLHSEEEYDPWDPSFTAQTIHEEEESEYIGLIDIHGKPIKKSSQKIPMGFHLRSK